MLQFDEDVRRGDTPPRVKGRQLTPRSPGSKPQTRFFGRRGVRNMFQFGKRRGGGGNRGGDGGGGGSGVVDA